MTAKKTSPEAFNAALGAQVAAALYPHVRRLRLNLQDNHVAASSFHLDALHPSPDAFVQLWVDTPSRPATPGLTPRWPP